MLVRTLCICLAVALVGSLDAAKRKRGRGKTVTKTVTKEEVEAKKQEKAGEQNQEKIATTAAGVNPPVNAGNEMEAYRAIQSRPLATVQDLADLLVMYRGEYAAFDTAEKRIARVRELKVLKDYKPDEKLRRGTVAYAVMKIYKPESGWIFWVTGWERYALRDLQEADIMPSTSTPGQNLSGEQLLGTMTAAEEYLQNRKDYRSKD